MDEIFRKLDREYQETEDPVVLDKILNRMLRIKTYEDWLKEADSDYLPQLRRRQESFVDTWVNAYEDFTARAAIYCYAYKHIATVTGWLTNYYTQYPLFYQGREITLYQPPEPPKDPFDFEEPAYPLPETFFDPPAKLKIIEDASPCFNFAPNLKPGEKREINLWGQREHYVSFGLVDDINEEAVKEQKPKDIESEEIDPFNFESLVSLGYQATYWLNVYSLREVYGGPEEGGWNYDIREPMACVYLGILPCDQMRENIFWRVNFDKWPEHLQEAWTFLESYFQEFSDRYVLELSTQIAAATGRQHYE